MSKSKANVVQLTLPRDKDSIEQLSDFMMEQNPVSAVVFGIDKSGQAFIAHTPPKTVPQLVMYLDTGKQMLQDEVITYAMQEAMIDYHENEEEQVS